MVRFLSLLAAVAFIFGYVLCVIAGTFSWDTNSAILVLLVLMGILVGIFNITGKEVVPFLVASVALILIGTVHPFAPLSNVNENFVEHLDKVIALLAIFTAPAALIQAIRAGVALAAPGD